MLGKQTYFDSRKVTYADKKLTQKAKDAKMNV
jgi:hypothetical protein